MLKNSRIIVAALWLLILTVACGQPASYAPDEVLKTAEQDSLKYEIIRYAGKLPPRANQANKFDAEFDAYYKQLAAQYQVLYLHRDQDSGYLYFFVARIAPSLEEKYVGTGGRLLKDGRGNISVYEEIFRTWKMPMPELKEKGAMLFGRMVRQQDLSAYYTVNTPNDFIIEFPNEETFFEKQQRRWISTREDMNRYYEVRQNDTQSKDSLSIKKK